VDGGSDFSDERQPRCQAANVERADNLEPVRAAARCGVRVGNGFDDDFEEDATLRRWRRWTGHASKII
jgi:hypothetical protein